MPKPQKKPRVKIIWEKAYWQRRAEDAHAIEATMRNADRKKVMKEIAECYERLAELTKQFRAISRSNSAQ